MAIARRVYVSVPGNQYLTYNQQQLKKALIDKVSGLGYIPEIFYSEYPDPGSVAQAKNWSLADCAAVLRRCVGAMIVGLPRHQFTSTSGPIRLPTEYAHIEGSMAVNLGLPTFFLCEKGTLERGIFHMGGAHVITSIPDNADQNWGQSPEFQYALSVFDQAIKERRDVFLGYCNTSSSIALNLKTYIEEKGVTVLDWATDFIPGRTIIEEIEEAANRTSVGVFLFSAADVLVALGIERAVPRDNVVFEAGFFAHAVGRERVLIIRQEGTKMPADLGGSIYATLPNSLDINQVKPQLDQFLASSI